ncbi:MAG: putative sigma-54 modulation protein [Patescibacteria group bacterium]|nr:putative sigma-54 modulation protein [Patescibacteria group bacterium]
MELTEAIHDYVEKKVTNLGKLLSKMEEEGSDVLVNFEVGKSTNHHKSGEFFHTDCSINIKGKKFYASSDKEDLYEAIDDVKDSLFGEISQNKDKSLTLFHKGARKIKDMIKGVTSFKK